MIFSDLFSLVGLALYELHKFEEALPFLENIVDLPEYKNKEYLFKYAKCLDTVNRIHDAVKILEECIDLYYN